MNTSAPDEDQQLVRLIEGGSEIAGAVAGGAIGMIGGPAGALAGGAAGVAVTRGLKRLGRELSTRLLGPRQQVRVGAAAAYAITEIGERLDRGDQLRADDFFDGQRGRMRADELLEGVLLHAANAYEERKVEHLGWLYASVAFDATVSPSYANFLLQLANRLTYKELVCLAFVTADRFEHLRSQVDAADTEGAPRAPEPLAAELDDLVQAGVIGVRQEDGCVPRLRGGWGGGDLGRIDSRTGPTSVGRDLYRLMNLDRIPPREFDQLLHELGVPSS